MTDHPKGLSPENIALLANSRCGLAINCERFLLSFGEMEVLLNAARQEGAKSAPEGWVMLPRDITMEMITAGAEEYADPSPVSGPDGEDADWCDPIQAAWYAMISAAPSVPDAGGQV